MALVVAGSDVVVYVVVGLVAALLLIAFIVGLLVCRWYRKKQVANRAMANKTGNKEVDLEAARDQSPMLEEGEASGSHS